MDAQAMEAIYNRLNSVTYTPLSADTFGDWTIEAGDILTVSKDGTSYQTPVMHSTLRWTGGSSVYIESTGNKEREPLNAQSKQAYESGYGGYYAGRHQSGLNLAFQDEFGYMRSYIDMTEEHLWLAFENDLSCTRSELLMTSESLRIAFENEISCTRSEFQMTSESLRVSFENDIASARSEFEMTAESLRTNFENEIDGMSSQIEQNASQIALKVNRGDVATQLAVEAGNVTVQGGNLVVEGMITAENIQASIADLSVLNVKAISASGNITSSNGVVMAPYFYLGTSGNARSLANAITALRLQQNGDQYTLQKQDFDDATWVNVGTFNRASGSSKVSGTWTGGTYTVSADENGQDLPISMSISSVIADGTVTYSNGLLNVPIKVMAAIGSGSAADTGYTQDFKVTAGPAMQAVDVSGNWDGTSGKFTAVSSANSAKKSETTITSVLADGTVTYSNGLLNVPIKVMARVGSGNAAETGYTQDFKVVPTAAMQAVDVSGSWDGTSGKFTAVSSSNSAKKSETTITSVLADGTVTYADGLLNVPIKVMAKVGTGSAADTGYTQDFKVSGTKAYNAGWDYGLTQIVRTAREATSQEVVIKTLSPSQKWTIVDTKTSSSGQTSETKYTVQAPADQSDAGFAAAKGTYTTTGGVLTISKSRTGSDFPLSFAINAGITYDTTTHKYTAKALVDETEMDTAEGGTQAYIDGWDGCFATRNFNAPTASKELSYGETVTVSASLKNSSGTTVSLGSRTYVAPEALWLYTGGDGSAGPLWPGTNYALRSGGASGTIHASWYIPNPWIDIVSSGTPIITLDYDTLIQAVAVDAGGNIWRSPNGIWKTPPDNYDTGYTEGRAYESGLYSRVTMSISERQQLSSGRYVYRLTYGPVSQAYTVGNTLTFYDK